MLHKPKISTLKHLHSIPRYFMHSIPIGSIVVLLTLTVISINPSPHTNTYALEDTNVRDTIGTNEVNDNNNDLAKVEREDSTVVKAEIIEDNSGSPADEVSALANIAEPVATLTISPGTGGNGAGQSETVLASTGAVAYRSHNVTVNVQDITKYSLQVSYAGGSNKMYLEDSNAYLEGADGKTPNEMSNNTWGFAWGNTTDVDSDMTYYTMPQYNENATNIQSGLLENQDTYNTNFTKKLVFAAKFGSNATAGHYKTVVMLSLTASPKEVTTTLDDIFQLQQMTSEICTSSVVGEANNEIRDQRGGATYTIRKLEDGRCWMTQNLRIVNKTITPDDSNVSSNYTIPASSSPWASDSSINTQSKVHYAGNTTNGAYYTWCAATAGSCSGATTNNAVASSSICPKGWKLPTKGEYDALIVKGTSKVDNNTSDSIFDGWNIGSGFFPAAGFVGSGSLKYVGTYGDYWSSTANGSNNAYLLYLSSSGVHINNDVRSYGYSVRCIAMSALDEISTMQEMTSNVCANMSIGDSKSLRDARDTNSYTVTKLKDGRCWMMDSLKLVGAKTLKSTDSDVKNDYSLPAPDSSPWSSTDPSIQKFYNATPALYTWCAATAGSCADLSTDGVIATESICPKGWHLPTLDEYKGLIDSGFGDGFAVSEDAKSISNGKLNTGGDIGINADYWSSSVKSNVQAYRLDVYGDLGYFGEGDMLSTQISNKYTGLPVRCIAS